MRTCPACGNQYPDDANFCPMDATKLAPAAAAVDASAATQRDQVAPFAGRFILSNETFATATGTVTVGQDGQNGSAKVWVKTVRPDALPNPAMADRALRELKQIAKITSERIVRVLDQGRTADGGVFVVTEQPDGVTLDRVLQQSGVLPVERAKGIILQIGEALTEAQKVGVIHRDVSPRNIFVGAGDRVKVGEFGLAAAVSDRVFGDPAFLSPEQVEGRAVDQRSNIYSLGALFHYLLVGQPPFTGDAASLLQQQLNSQPPSLASARPGLSPEVDRVVQKSLEKSGGRRHLTLRQMLTELQALSGEEGAAQNFAATAPNPIIPTPDARPMAATVMGMPSPFAGAPAGVAMAPTMQQPAPQVTPAASAAPAAASPAPANATKAAAPQAAGPPAKGFRETAWFKAGEIEEELAKAQAANASTDPLAPTGTTGMHDAVDPSKLEISAQDKARLSLKTGHTQVMAAVKPSALPGERMDEKDMAAEFSGGGNKKWVIIAAAAAVVVIGLVLALTMGGGSKKPEEKKSALPSSSVVRPA